MQQLNAIVFALCVGFLLRLREIVHRSVDAVVEKVPHVIHLHVDLEAFDVAAAGENGSACRDCRE